MNGLRRDRLLPRQQYAVEGISESRSIEVEPLGIAPLELARRKLEAMKKDFDAREATTRGGADLLVEAGG